MKANHSYTYARPRRTRHAVLTAALASAVLMFTPLTQSQVAAVVEKNAVVSAATMPTLSCSGLQRSDFRYVKTEEGRAVQAALHALYKDDPRYQEEAGTSQRPLSDGIIGPVTLSWLKYFCEARALSGEQLPALVIRTLLAPPVVVPARPRPPVIVPEPAPPAAKGWSYFMLSDTDLKTLAAPGALSGELTQWNAALVDLVDVRYADRKALKTDMDTALKATGPEVDAYKEKLLAAVQTVKVVTVTERSLLRLQGRLAEASLALARSELLEIEFPTTQALTAAAQAAGIADPAELQQIAAKAEAGSYIVLTASALQKPIAAVHPIPPEMLALLQPLAGTQFAGRGLLESAMRAHIAAGSITYGEAVLRCPFVYTDCQSKQRTDRFKAADAIFLALRKNIGPVMDASRVVGNVELPLTTPEMESLFGDAHFNVGGRRPTREDVYTMWQEQKPDEQAQILAAHGAWMQVARDDAAIFRAINFKQALRAQMLFHRYSADIDAQIDVEKTDTEDAVNALWTGNGCGCVQDGLAGVVYGFYPYGKGAPPPMPLVDPAVKAPVAAVPPQKLNFSVLSSIGVYGLSFDDQGRLVERTSGRFIDAQFPNADTMAFIREAGKWETRVDWVLHKNWEGSPADKAALFKQLSGELERFLTRPLPGFATGFWAAVAAPFPSPHKNKLLTMGDGITLHFENYPEDVASVKQFDDFVAVLQQRLAEAGQRYAVNIVVPAHQLGAGIYGFKNLSNLISGRYSGEVYGKDARVVPDMYALVLLPEPVNELKQSLRAAIEAGLLGEERVFMLRHTVPIVGSGTGDQESLSDQIIYAKDNFGGVGLWPLPLGQSEFFNDDIVRTIKASYIDDAGRVIGDQTLGTVAPGVADSVQAWVCQWRNWIRLLFLTALVVGAGCYAAVRLTCNCEDKISYAEFGAFAGLALAVLSFVALLFFDPDMGDVASSRVFWMAMIAVTAIGVGLPYVLKLKKSQNPSRTDYRATARPRGATLLPIRPVLLPRSATSPAGDSLQSSIQPSVQPFVQPLVPTLHQVVAEAPRDAQWHAQLREALLPLWEYLNEAPHNGEAFDFTRQRMRELSQPLAVYLQGNQSMSTRAYEEAAAAVEALRRYLERDSHSDLATRARVRVLIKNVRAQLSNTEKEKEHSKMRQTLNALGARLEQEARELAVARKKIDGLMQPLWSFVDALDEAAQREADAGRIRELRERLLDRKQVNEP